MRTTCVGGSVAEWLVCWTQAQKGLGSNRSRDAVGSGSHPLCLCSPSSKISNNPFNACEGNCRLPPCLWLTSPTGWLPRTGISSGTLRSVIEYGLPLPFYPSRSWYSIKRPQRDATVSWPSWLVTYRGGIPAWRRSPIPVLTGGEVIP